MKIEQQHIDRIREAFGKMQSKDDFLKLLNDVKPLVYGKNAVPFKLSQLTWYSNPKINKKRYKQFTIKKKSGADRVIHSPVEGLLSIQKTLSFILQCVFEPHKGAYGFVQGRSIVDNAQLHTGRKYVFNIDLKDFFPSIDQARVWKCLQLKPFNLIDTDTDRVKFVSWDEFQIQFLKSDKPINFVKNIFDGHFYARTERGIIKIPQATDINQEMFVMVDQFSQGPISKIKVVNRNKTLGRRDIANMIASLCCHELSVERKNLEGVWHVVMANVLPQGAPTSPVITNIICQRLDNLLSGVAKRFGLKYSRYADDITFSSDYNVFQAQSDFLTELQRIITDQGFHVKESKTRLQKEGYRQEVTGLLVSEKVNVQKKYVKQLRMWLYYWERYGYERGNEFFLQKYSVKQTIGITRPVNMAAVIAGKLDYLKMVKGESNSLYRKLLIRYNAVSLENPILFKKERISMRLFKQKLLEKEVKFRETWVKREKEVRIEVENSKILADVNFIIHDPTQTINLLNKFTEDTYLKYTTHIWDKRKETSVENILRTEFQERLYDEFYRIYKFQKLQEIGLEQFYWTIAGFIVGPNVFGWGASKIKFGWYNVELIQFYLTNIERQPGSFELPDEYLPNIKIEGKYLKYFDDVIDVFKNQIQFRGSALYFAIKKEFEAQLGFEYNIEFEGLKGIEIYTSTEQIIDALQIIASNIRQRPEKGKQIKISGRYNPDGKYFELSISDVGSFSYAPINSDKLMLRDNKGQLFKIRDLFVSLCDFSIESKFRDESNNFIGAEIVYLSRNKSKIHPDDLPEILDNADPIGFTYKMKFYE